jgi:hypothetical protein
MPLARWLRRGLLVGAWAICVPAAAQAAPVEWLPAQSPFYDELQIVRTEGLLDTTASIESRPMSRVEVATLVAFALTHHPEQASTNAGLVRLRREFSRELVQMGFEAEPRYLAPLVEVRGERREAFRVIPYLDAAFEQNTDGVGRLADHSRIGGRVGVEFGNALLYADLFAGRIDGGRHFADPLVQNTDFIVYTEDTYLSAHTPWIDLSLGRTRSGWGPGHEGTLLWSPTAPPVTSLLWNASLFGGHLRGSALHADIDASRGERVAAHRLDFELSPRLHLGVSEAARYHASNWEPLYVVSVIPFTLVQRMQQQDGGDSTVRNNVMVAGDVRWRAARGTTLYGELLFDDLTFKQSGTPVRMAYQAGWLGAGTVFGRRISWRAEYSRVYRYVYAVFYGENFIHQDRPLGYPEGPDSRDLVARGALDWNPNWRFTLAGGKVDHGEGFLGEFFDPEGPPTEGSVLSGIVEKTRFVETGAEWTPRDGVSANLLWGYQWQDDAGHVSGANREAWYGRVGLSLRH